MYKQLQKKDNTLSEIFYAYLLIILLKFLSFKCIILQKKYIRGFKIFDFKKLNILILKEF